MNSVKKNTPTTKPCQSLSTWSVHNSAAAVAATSRFFLTLTFFSVLLVTLAGAAQAQTQNVLYSFTGATGSQPYASLIQDAQGNLYGTTASGGTYGFGTVFRSVLECLKAVLGFQS
jgi:hypothetical protein